MYDSYVVTFTFNAHDSLTEYPYEIRYRELSIVTMEKYTPQHIAKKQLDELVRYKNDKCIMIILICILSIALQILIGKTLINSTRCNVQSAVVLQKKLY